MIAVFGNLESLGRAGVYAEGVRPRLSERLHAVVLLVEHPAPLLVLLLLLRRVDGRPAGRAKAN
jgi:hypothetical protein